MDEDGRGVAEGVVEEEVAGGAGQPFVAAEDVADLHGVVIDDGGEVVGGEAVGLEQDVVVQEAILEGDVAAEGVGDNGGAFVGHLEADDAAAALMRDRFADLGVGEGAAVAVVAGGLLGLLLGLADAVESFGGAGAAVGVAGGEQLRGGGLVAGQSLGLAVGGVRPADVGAFVPVEAEPAEALHDAVFRTGDGALLVGVFDAEDECAAVMAGEEPVEEGGAEAADVKLAGGAGAESDADAHGVEPVMRVVGWGRPTARVLADVPGAMAGLAPALASGLLPGGQRHGGRAHGTADVGSMHRSGAAQDLEQVLDIVGGFDFDAEAQAGGGVVEGEEAGVQGLAVDEVGGVPVDRVADDGVAEGGHVHADLVGAPGDEVAIEQGGVEEALLDGVLGGGWFAAIDDGHAAGVGAVAPDGGLDAPLEGSGAPATTAT